MEIVFKGKHPNTTKCLAQCTVCYTKVVFEKREAREMFDSRWKGY